MWVVCRISRAWVLGRMPQLRHHSASREKQSIKTCLSAQQVFILPFFHRSFDPASKPLLHYIPGTNVCGFFLVSAFTGIAVGVFARFHYVTLFLVTRQPQHPARGRYFPQSFASGNGSATSCNEPNASHSPTIKCQPRGR